MILDLVERYLIELILLGLFFFTGPLARIIAYCVTEESEEATKTSYSEIKSSFRLMFAVLIALWLMLFKVLFPLLQK